jgi:hypothetical protein
MSKETKMKFKILALSANDKATEWAIKLKATFGLSEAKRKYQVGILVDDEHFAEKVSKIEEEITNAKATPDLFEDFKSTIKSLEMDIKKVEKEKKDFEALISKSLADFQGIVAVADFDKDTFIINVPESIVPDLINIRHNVDAFMVNLK